MTKIESQLERMASPIRPRIQGAHNAYTPFRVQVKFGLCFLGAVVVTVFIILCCAKAVR